ncbi:4-hydroxythreonine-4-phosphate dehydrogenase PdxA [Bryobacter aggregatus]|uniref:4-hydroxythreonine-4-phosphate dehydrogenase PdxA n=1 Tax=Bryobacter aggregatus TaxID=360054 RepID=UPI0004E174A0|nr:4-hydroxythreonine-4-phosphate dehydrogenase PdxA [Bryobacter aggregatus]
MHLTLPFGVTLGDSSGVGPEILLQAFHSQEIQHPIVVYGDLAALAFYNKQQVPLHPITTPADYTPGPLNVISPSLLERSDITPGQLNAKSGHAAREYVIAAAKAALAGEIAAMVTLPMNKEATQKTDPHFVGHTELIGAVCGVDDVTIMLASDQLIVTHVTTHCSLLEAIARTKRPRIQTILQLTSDAVSKLIPNPRIAVAGLNPHAGEHGLFGREEIDEIEPAIAWAKQQGMPVEGPFPPDTLFYLAVRRKRFDAIVCMYHDQGHVPLKLLDFEGGVNIALGLPIIRTSVDHGTAFDIAGQGIAQSGSFIKALEFAVRMASVQKDIDNVH